MTPNCKKSIFLYNKSDELITYVDLNESGKLVNFYQIHDNTMTKITTSEFTEKNKQYVDTNKAIVVFQEPCKLFHMFLDGDSYCKAIKKESTRIEPPTVVSRVCSHNDELIEGYTIKPDLIKEWTKKT